jgi:ubiquinone/menaquinone biosynthesis C-methylase UbiE
MIKERWALMTDPMTDTPNAEQFEAWNGEAGERWAREAARRDKVLAPVADALFAAARIGQGDAVLDIGCGCGATTISAAREAGSAGSALGIDISEPMLAVARRRAREQAAANVRFEHADAQVHVLPTAAHDIAISRFGTMFFADPPAAFANIARATRSAARLCLVTWQPLAANDWLTVPAAALLRYAAPPEQATGPGMFAQADPAGLASTLAAGGYESIQCDPVAVDLTVGTDAAEAAGYLTASGPGRILLETIADNDRQAAIDALRSALAEHASPDGVRLGAAVWITTATRRI